MLENNNQGTLVSSVILEVLDVDDLARTVTLNYRGKSGSVVGTIIYPIDFCPETARIPGGAFYVDKFKIDSKDGPKYVSRTRGVDPEQERRILEELLGHPNS